MKKKSANGYGNGNNGNDNDNGSGKSYGNGKGGGKGSGNGNYIILQPEMKTPKKAEKEIEPDSTILNFRARMSSSLLGPSSSSSSSTSSFSALSKPSRAIATLSSHTPQGSQAANRRLVKSTTLDLCDSDEKG
jgi:hypothetical protein